ncbi:hypothetical protein [Campylobacter sp. MG1]|uniref:hypothetical protein n=1 Tax=Campylobacter sp. MG1 TaxID=2976332 RepID=UPI00226CAE26|nr:hypothetical protein [Campylobacter sp. MG1]
MLSVDNKKALDLILKNLNKNITHTYGCFFDRYDMNIYGLNKTNDINTFLNNIENAKKLDNINMKIIAYKEKE